jgi:NTE family protein
LADTSSAQLKKKAKFEGQVQHKKMKIGITLSGGGARGIAHLGVLKALEEFGVKVSILSGTSAGAIAGAFYAKGYAIEEILEIIKSGHFFGMRNFLFKEKGLFSMKGFEEIYKKHFPSNSFDELNFPLYVAATDILKGEINYFSSGDLSAALMASSCVPVIFDPVKMNNSLYVDGGLLNNFPLEPLIGKCDKLIGVDVNSIRKEKAEIRKSNLLDRSFHLSLSANTQTKAAQCDLFIQPPDMSQFGMFEVKKSQEIFEYGYQYGLTLEKEIKALLG